MQCVHVTRWIRLSYWRLLQTIKEKLKQIQENVETSIEPVKLVPEEKIYHLAQNKMEKQNLV